MRLLLALVLFPATAMAADGPAVSYVGRPVAAVLDAFRAEGHPFAYSTSLVGSDLFVTREPTASSVLEIVNEILQPHKLIVREDSGVYLVVRMIAPEVTDERHEGAVRGEQSVAAEIPIETVVVSASRYAISRDISSSKFSLNRRTIQNMPDVGEDPIRVTQRLPGAAASGGSAVAHFRGGDTDDVGIMLNGQWLFDPYHVRDFQNIFSAIDARAIEGVEVYTGGFPVRYGDRMSGLVLLDSIEAEESRHSEIGLSVFNTSFLTTGTKSGKSWLLSARRGNLDLIIDPKFGRPSYFDVFGQFEINLTPSTRLSVNGLYADDDIELVLETEQTERDQISSDTRNAQLWLRLDTRWSDDLSSSSVLSALDYSNSRLGFSNDRDKMVATVFDQRAVQQVAFRQDWLWAPTKSHQMQWGLQATADKANFNYVGNAEYFGLPALFENQPVTETRVVAVAPEGGSYAVYVSDRWRLRERTVLEWGLRWDDQTYTNLSSDSQLSPRLNILFLASDKLEFRMSVGRYFQSQPIQALQVEDGVSQFWPAQRADHIILGARFLAANDTSLRLEVFNKNIGRVRPRFENLYDPLGLMPELQVDRVFIAPSRATARGLELSADQSLGRFGWWASYTWSKVTDRLDGVDVLRSWDQTHSLQGGLDWHSDKWNFSTAISAHTGWPTTELQLIDSGADSSGDPIFTAVRGPRNTSRHNWYASLDMRLSRSFDVRRGKLSAFFEVSNVLDRRNVCCLDWDIDDESSAAVVLERGQDYWLPLLPAIGVLWEF